MAATCTVYNVDGDAVEMAIAVDVALELDEDEVEVADTLRTPATEAAVCVAALDVKSWLYTIRARLFKSAFAFTPLSMSAMPIPLPVKFALHAAAALTAAAV